MKPKHYPKLEYLLGAYLMHLHQRNIVITLVPYSSSFPFPHLWTGARFFVR
jgi:hypothetical protein